MIRRYGAGFLANEGQRLTLAQRRTLAGLAACRTPALGYRVWGCDACGQRAMIYRSCGDRHCPQCQGTARQRWLVQRTRELLPVGYFHAVFTVPEQLHLLAVAFPRMFYALLLRATRETLQTVAADRRYLGARIGGVMVLHTWGQTLQLHPHVHVIIPGGGLSADGQRWIPSAPDFFLPVEVLSRVFRRKLLRLIAAEWQAGRLSFRGEHESLCERRPWARWLADLRRRAWVVYCQPPLGGPEIMLKYLARYTYRVAISNSRLLSLDGQQVTFRYKDYAADGDWRTMSLPAGEFLRRFSQHILPPRFVRIRTFGLLCGRGRDQRLALCRRLLAGSPAAPAVDAAPPAALPAAATAPVGAAVAADPVGPADPAEPNPAGARLCPHCGQASWWLLEEQLPSRSLGELAWLYFRPGAVAGRGYWNSS